MSLIIGFAFCRRRPNYAVLEAGAEYLDALHNQSPQMLPNWKQLERVFYKVLPKTKVKIPIKKDLEVVARDASNTFKVRCPIDGCLFQPYLQAL